MAELVVPAEPATLLDAAVEVLAESAFKGGARVFAAGVYSAEVVSAFDPAEDDPEDANEEGLPYRLRLKTHWIECKAGSACWGFSETAAHSREQHGTGLLGYTSC